MLLGAENFCLEKYLVRSAPNRLAAPHARPAGQKHKGSNMKLAALLMCVVITGIPITAHTAEVQLGVAKVSVENYIPHTGEIMELIQIRHSKLWFAGNAKNWELANYELSEVKEGLNDLVKYHPGVDYNVQIREYVNQPINNIYKAIESRSIVEFKKSFDSLTGGCNACHQEAERSFIKIKRPGISSFSNQEFAIK